MDRDILFIGHANPEDNEFTSWIQAKLENEGYKVESDLSFLIGGEEDYWKSLQDLLEQGTIKYLLVFSKSTFTKQGVLDEWEQVKSIARKEQLQDFIYILKIDDVAFDTRIGLNRKNHLRFDQSWSFGLQKLMMKLSKDEVSRKNDAPLSVDNWLKNRFAHYSGIEEKTEEYYSNWLEIPRLPRVIYLFGYNNSDQAKVIEGAINDYPIIRHDNWLITFCAELPDLEEQYGFTIAPTKRLVIETEKANKWFDTETFPNHDDLKRFLVQLLKEAWTKFLASKGLSSYEMSNRTTAFYYERDKLLKDKVHFQYQGKPTYKQLVGDYYEDFWHYATSCSVFLFPFQKFSLNSHLLFSTDGNAIWSDKKKLHKARRSKGKTLYNEQWRMLLLAFLASIASENGELIIPLSKESSLMIDSFPIMFVASRGYEEPQSNARLVPLDYFDEDDEDESDEDDFIEIQVDQEKLES